MHKHTHIYTGFYFFVGTLRRRNGFYTVQTIFSIALHLTGNILLFQIFNTLHSLFYKLASWWGPKKCPHKVEIDWYYYPCHTHLTLKTWSSSSRSSELLQLPLGTEITFSTEPTSAERHREALTRATTSERQFRVSPMFSSIFYLSRWTLHRSVHQLRWRGLQ